ncbi:MAG: AMMECR1 domain-containing protein [Firmicutes bacterium HGW-Firmicutes-15]|nr:MAG: AMMECR1 domain-containing protein [Firmicutes bacterium HGW-Firmicutes-15]
MITYAALSPHPPIIIPEVGGDRAKEAISTIQAMQAMAVELLASSPDTVVFLTPHGNVFSDCITCLIEPQLSGDLSSFGRPDVRTSHPNDLALVQELMMRAEDRSINMIGINQDMAERHKLNAQIDHGILVPLYYLEKAGMGDKPVVAISVGYLDNIELYALGRMIHEVADSLNKRVAVVASGDMSHRLKNEGPYDFHPDGSTFDLTVKELFTQNDVEGLLDIPEKLRKNAGECGYCSIVIMLGTMDGYDFQTKILSYEGPFGVGYLTAGFHPGKQSPSILEKLEARQAGLVEARRADESPQVRWARMTLENYIKSGKNPDLPREMESLLQDRAGAFVSIKKHGQLRGCIGTFLPVYKNLAEEIKNNALAAGLEDPRFPPVKAEELSTLVYSVDILAEPEPCKREELDPKRYGVIVSNSGKRGLLLPDLEGVDTVEQQLQIALQKGGILPREQYSIQRFEVKRYS